jgi:hypothetical protein
VYDARIGHIAPADVFTCTCRFLCPSCLGVVQRESKQHAIRTCACSHFFYTDDDAKTPYDLLSPS